jgi:uncharacterized protein
MQPTQGDQMKRLRIALLTFAVAAPGVAAAGASAAAVRTITVQGTGIVTTVPDRAQFSFGVSTTGKTARQALAANAARMNRVIAALKAQGIASADIQTAEISLSPNTNQSGSTIIDFGASNTVTVNAKDIAKAGSIVDAAVGAGANLAGGPTLTPSDQALLTRRALGKAIADARARALAIAAAAHVELGAVRTVTEVTSSPIVTSTPFARSSVAAGTPVEAGTIQTEEDVTVTFAIG